MNRKDKLGSLADIAAPSMSPRVEQISRTPPGEDAFVAILAYNLGRETERRGDDRRNSIAGNGAVAVRRDPAARRSIRGRRASRLFALGVAGPGETEHAPINESRTAAALQEGRAWSSEASPVSGSGSVRSKSRARIVARNSDDRVESLSSRLHFANERVMAGEAALGHATDELRRLYASHVNMQELERQRIAAELHDGLGQALTLIRISIESAAKKLTGRSSQASDTLKGIVPAVVDAMDEVRRISKALHPSSLDQLGVLATLAWQCRRLAAINPSVAIQEIFDVREDQIATALKLPIYRIVQEATNNTLKYAQASTIRISLRWTERSLNLCVEDDGCGFDLAQSRKQSADAGGLGLLSMRERAMLSAGTYELQAVPGRGTRVIVTWPHAAQSSQTL